jgi:hypothetical protein
MGRVRLKELMDFHNQGKETFRVAMKAWRKEAKEFSARYEYADDDHLIAQRDEIESLLDRGHTFGIVGLNTFLGAEPTDEKILHSWAYPLPHRGATLGDGNGWSRLTDGNLESYWKSNPYLTKAYTGEDDSLHPQWVMIDFGAKVDVNAIKIAWADPYAKRYYVQFWTGELEPFYDGINKGAWQTFPMGTITDGKGGTPTLKLVSWEDPGAVSSHLDDGIVQHPPGSQPAGATRQSRLLQGHQ